MGASGRIFFLLGFKKMSAACVWARNGKIVTETRPAWEAEYPLGECRRIVQSRDCVCGEGCDDFWPPGSDKCTSGCGGMVHNDAEWFEERVRYAQPLGQCRSQVQKWGKVCKGEFGGVNHSFEESWCVPEGNSCSSRVALFLFANCTAFTVSSTEEETPHALEAHDSVIVVACSIAGGFLLLSGFVVACYCLWEKNVRLI